jgi:hypothetical protein
MNTKIFLAATSHIKSAIVPYFKPQYILESFMDFRSKTKATRNYIEWCMQAEDFLLDSGAFTFMNKSKRSVGFTNEMLDKYIDEYIDFINTYDIKHFFEMDIDCVVGYERVKEIRRYIESKTNKQVIPVWHITRGIEDFHEMCKTYKYVAIGGIAAKEIKRSEHHLLYELCDIAHSYGCKVHGLGYMALTTLNDRTCPFDTVDGTSWQGHIRGYYYALNDGKLEKIKDDRNWRELDNDSWKAWTTFAKLPDVYQEKGTI